MTAAPTAITTPKSNRGRLLLPYQTAWCNDHARLKLWPKSRRIGATYCEAFDAVEKRLNPASTGYRRTDYWFSSADESAAFEFVEYCRFFHDKVFGSVADYFTDQVEDPDTKRAATAFCIRFENGARITAMSSNPRRFRSKGGDVRLDEFDFHDDPDGMYKAAYPVIMWGDSLAILSTHNGEGTRFHKFRGMAERVEAGQGHKGDMPWSMHLVTILDAVAQGLVEKINEIKGTELTREQFLADARAGCSTEEEWREEFLAVPSSESSAWLPYRLIELCEDDLAGRPDKFGDGPRYLGADIGESKDPTAIYWGEQVGDVMWVRERIVLQGEPLHVVQQMILDRLRHPKTVRGCIDGTGLGTQIGQAAEAQGNGEAIKFTSGTKDLLASPMRGYFEDRSIRVPGISDTRESLHSIRMTRMAGHPRYDAARTADGHGDEFWAAALMMHAGKSNDEVGAILL